MFVRKSLRAKIVGSLEIHLRLHVTDSYIV